MKKYDITPAAFVVVLTLGLIALWFGFVTGWLYMHGRANEAKDSALALGAVTTPLAAILARTKNDPAPAGTPADPLTVKTAEQPLEVTPAREPSPAGTAGWLTGPDGGHVSTDLLAMLLAITAGVFLGGLLLHLVLT